MHFFGALFHLLSLALWLSSFVLEALSMRQLKALMKSSVVSLGWCDLLLEGLLSLLALKGEKLSLLFRLLAQPLRLKRLQSRKLLFSSNLFLKEIRG
jgi:hypothetical protein